MNEELLKLLACPVTHSRLRAEGDAGGEWLVSEEGLRYPVKEGLPILLPEAAEVPAPFKSLEEFRASRVKT